MTCDSCVEAVSGSLYALGTVTSVQASLADQLVTIEGTAAPSSLVKAIQATGRDAILRGSGDQNSAAVSILESYAHLVSPDAGQAAADLNLRNVRGLARMVQVAPTTTLVDLSVSGLSAGTYRATVRALGDVGAGARSTGPVWEETRGDLGTLRVGEDGHGTLFVDGPFPVWEIIGRGLVVFRDDGDGVQVDNGPDTLAGVVARSAGVWDNDKLVCSCTGKTLWDERRDEVSKGML